MNPENFSNTETKKLLENSEGKKYEYQKDGVYYGGDYLAELPAEIHIDIDSTNTVEGGLAIPEDLPPPPEEINQVI